jgi:hypothetical protein
VGLTAADASKLRARLLEVAWIGEAKLGEVDAYGERYTIDFTMVTAVGKGTVRSGWIIIHGKREPRLTTCYVIKRKR